MDLIEIPAQLFEELAAQTAPIESEAFDEDFMEELAPYGVRDLLVNQKIPDTMSQFGERREIVVADGYGGYWRATYWFDWDMGPEVKTPGIYFYRADRIVETSYRYVVVSDAN